MAARRAADHAGVVGRRGGGTGFQFAITAARGAPRRARGAAPSRPFLRNEKPLAHRATAKLNADYRYTLHSLHKRGVGVNALRKQLVIPHVLVVRGKETAAGSEILSCSVDDWECRVLVRTEEANLWPVEIRKDIVLYNGRQQIAVRELLLMCELEMSLAMHGSSKTTRRIRLAFNHLAGTLGENVRGE